MADSVSLTDMFGSLHADADMASFIKEEAIFNADGENLPFGANIDDITDFFTSTDTDLSLEINNIQPSTSFDVTTPDFGDPSHQLHGDQKKVQHSQHNTNNRQEQALSRIHNDINNPKYSRQSSVDEYQHNIQTGDFARLSQTYNKSCLTGVPNQEQFISNCLPESPPDSGSEAYSPLQDVSTRSSHSTQRFSQDSSQMQREYHHSQSYERSPPHMFQHQVSFDGRIQNSNAPDYNTGIVESQYNSAHIGQMESYDIENAYCRIEAGITNSGNLSPGSNSSNESAHNCQGVENRGVPASKKRKFSNSLNIVASDPLNASLLHQHYHHNLAQQQPIKRELALLRSSNGVNERRTGAYLNEAYELNEGNNPVQFPVQSRPLTISGPSRLSETRQLDLHTDRVYHLANNIPQNNCSENNSAYQVITWSSFLKESWTSIHDGAGKQLQPPSYRVDADKGFNFATSDDTFVCQKKNHFQVTVHIGMIGQPQFVKTEEGLKSLEGFYISLYGVKYESQNQTIAIEQSQSDRSKKAFHPVKVDIPGDQTTKVTIGRLHFSETTTNNMRKKGRPNPDQRYFLCVVALHAQAGGKNHLIAAAATEKIIVRASNPGQFDQDDVPWQRSQVHDGLYHHGRVGINHDHPDEALVVHGNIRLTGHLMQPSDRRAKEAIQEVDTSAQLEKLRNIRICRYRYSPEYAMYAGIDSNREETGVIAQEFARVLPEAVTETGDVMLPNGETIQNFLVVDKDRLYMETVGAVKELCKLTGNFEEKIDELQRWNKKLTKLRKYDSVRSNTSALSGFTSSFTTPSVSRQGSTRTVQKESRPSMKSNDRRRRKPPSTSESPPGCMSSRFMQMVVITLVVIMLISVVAMAVLYIMVLNTHKGTDGVTETVTSGTTLPTTLGSTATETARTLSMPAAPPSHSSTTATPINYCPPDNFDCDSNLPYCCSNEETGGKLDFICEPIMRDGHQHLGGVSAIDPKSLLSTTSQSKFGGKGVENERHTRKKNSTLQKKRYKFPNDIDAEGDAVEILNVSYPENEEIDPNNDMNPGPRNPPHSLKKRSTKEKSITAITDSILLVKPNVTLYNNSEEKSEYLYCENLNKNYTFNIPVSSHTPTDILVNMRFNLNTVGTVILCSRNGDPTCVDDVDSKGVTTEKIPQSHKGPVAAFQLYFSNYVNVNYLFRVTTAADDPADICDLPNDEAGSSYTEYLMHFYRTCEKQIDNDFYLQEDTFNLIEASKES